jgi:FKBP-type peptidyl-prolyl cis-trans isomerase SlyD
MPSRGVATIQPNAHVTLDYTLRGDDGEVLDTSDGDDGEPIAYVHGYGMLVPGLETALTGLAVGDEREIVVPAEAGYGERDEDLVLEVDPSDFPHPEKVKPGDEYVAEAPDGDEILMRVLERRSDAVIVDANHPLAGRTLHYSVTVRGVRAATEEEIETAAAAVDEAEEHLHGPECGHEQAPDVITIGRRKRELS